MNTEPHTTTTTIDDVRSTYAASVAALTAYHSALNAHANTGASPTLDVDTYLAQAVIAGTNGRLLVRSRVRSVPYQRMPWHFAMTPQQIAEYRETLNAGGTAQAERSRAQRIAAARKRLSDAAGWEPRSAASERAAAMATLEQLGAGPDEAA